MWKTAGVYITGEVLYGPSDKPYLPHIFSPHYAKLTHRKCHGPGSLTSGFCLDFFILWNYEMIMFSC